MRFGLGPVFAYAPTSDLVVQPVVRPPLARGGQLVRPVPPNQATAANSEACWVLDATPSCTGAGNSRRKKNRFLGQSGGQATIPIRSG